MTGPFGANEAIWRRMPARSLLRFLLAVFAAFATLGFVNDILLMGRLPAAGLATLVVYSGAIATFAAYLGIRHFRLFVPVAVPVLLASSYLVRYITPDVPAGALDAAALKSRLTVDALGCVACVVSGYVLFVSFIQSEGRRHLRLQTEMDLAASIHAVLAPPVSLRTPRWEILGRSMPTAQVGGDLVDAVQGIDALTCYVADVSGHGVPAGTLMGMLKAATRMRLRGEPGLDALLSDLNQVLLEVKRPNMFVTCAALRLEPSGAGRYAVAGHPPILHRRARDGAVFRLADGQIPLGILEGQNYASSVLALAPGDLLAVVSDGLTEVVDRTDRELGLEPIEGILVRHAGDPLPNIFESVMARVRAHGPQVDDQTLLLIRALP